MAESAGNALISVYDKTGITDFAGGLHELGWMVYASGGTHKAITEAGIPATDVADLVGGTAILGHKVVTLSREIAAGLLADPNNPEEVAEMKQAGYPIIDLVCQDSYPLEEEINKLSATPESVRAQTDIGGPTMLSEAAKGRRIVLSVAEQRQEVLDWLRAGKPDETTFVQGLVNRAIAEVARYRLIEAKYWNGENLSGHFALKQAPTKYGENPQQGNSAFYADNRVNIDPLGIDQFIHVQGMERSFINITDIDRLLQTATHIAAGFERNFGSVPPMAIGVKHGNACGAGIDADPVKAVERMLDGDTRAIFGGVVMLNGEITTEVAEALMHHSMDGDQKRALDGVVGASVSDEALEILSRNKLRVVVNPALASLNEASLDSSRRLRPLRGAYLEQPNYTFVQDLQSAELVRHGEFTEEQERDLILAWAIGSTSNSNTITLVKNGALIGNGVGQQDRVGAGQLSLIRTSTETPQLTKVGPKLIMTSELDANKIEGAAAYSDSFFPFPDGPTVLAEAGLSAVLTTSGSKGDEPVIAALRAKNVSIMMIPDKVGRGFYGH